MKQYDLFVNMFYWVFVSHTQLSIFIPTWETLIAKWINWRDIFYHSNFLLTKITENQYTVINKTNNVFDLLEKVLGDQNSPSFITQCCAKPEKPWHEVLTTNEQVNLQTSNQHWLSGKGVRLWQFLSQIVFKIKRNCFIKKKEIINY